MQMTPTSFWMVVNDLESWEGTEGSYVVGIDQFSALVIAMLVDSSDPHNILIFDQYGSIGAGIVVSRTDTTAVENWLDYLSPDFIDSRPRRRKK